MLKKTRLFKQKHKSRKQLRKKVVVHGGHEMEGVDILNNTQLVNDTIIPHSLNNIQLLMLMVGHLRVSSSAVRMWALQTFT